VSIWCFVFWVQLLNFECHLLCVFFCNLQNFRFLTTCQKISIRLFIYNNSSATWTHFSGLPKGKRKYKKKRKEKLEWYPETLDYLLIINNYYTIFLDSHLSFNFRIPKLLSSSNPSTRRNLDLFLFLKHRRISAEPRKLLNNLNSPESAKSVGGLNTLSSQKCNDPFINCLYSA